MTIDTAVSNHRGRRSIALTGLIIVCFVAWLGLQIPKGILTNTDELLTAERSREMLLTTPWVVPISVGLLVSSTLFSAETGRALLDIGLAFFVTLAILFAHLARKHPAWWIGVAFACWLGSLQKVPLIFLIWLLVLIIRASLRVERRTLFSGWLIASILFAVATTAIWPLVQLLKYHMPLKAYFTKKSLSGLAPSIWERDLTLKFPFA